MEKRKVGRGIGRAAWIADLNRVLRGTSPVAQWLRLRAPNARGPGLIPGQGTRSHMPHGSVKIEEPVCRN